MCAILGEHEYGESPVEHAGMTVSRENINLAKE
jgi:hypothetical protein